MLPRAYRLGVADLESYSGRSGAGQVGYQAILGPVTTADDIASTSRRDADTIFRSKKTLPIALGHELRVRFQGDSAARDLELRREDRR